MLIVHLKRFAGSAKISSPVEFPLEGLDLSEVVKSPQVGPTICVDPFPSISFVCNREEPRKYPPSPRSRH